ncbi:hypothetical protein LEP1GSC179_0389 [Leptospira santarosai str. MOR084]|uniref:Uncharacterized protein n=1 Tax=Leptospira santarosai str. MOR084 TaxID=1049984 RepID=A0A0E2BKX9_9LEPT|nr:hypothetical protein LEP1GSC179_0389 [Leptospira santarosai str. MOR084]
MNSIPSFLKIQKNKIPKGFSYLFKTSDLERVSKLLVLLNCNYLLVKCTKIIQRYRTSFGKK